jgi:hypothetical protein
MLGSPVPLDYYNKAPFKFNRIVYRTKGIPKSILMFLLL